MKRESSWVETWWGGAQGIRAQVESGEQTHGVGVAGLTQYQPTWGAEGIHMGCQPEWAEVSLPLTGVDQCRVMCRDWGDGGDGGMVTYRYIDQVKCMKHNSCQVSHCQGSELQIMERKD